MAANWTQAERQLCDALVTEGLRAPEIAVHMGRTRSAVNARLALLRRAGRAPNDRPDNPVWTEPRLAELSAVMNLGLTTTKAAERLGVTKNAVIGALHRSQWIRRGGNTWRAPSFCAPCPEPDRPEAGCRWIDADPQDPAWAFCGAPTTHNWSGLPSSYCAEHHPRVWIRAS